MARALIRARDTGGAGPGASARPRVARVLGLVAALLVASGFALGVHLSNLHNGLLAASFTAVGVFVLDRRPGHREGWLFVAVGLAHAVMFFGRQYGLAGLPGAVWVQWLGVWPLAPVLVLTGVTLICFPDGRLPSPRWRPVVVAMTVVGALLALASALWPVEYADNALTVPHPLDLPGAATAQQVWNVAGPAAYLLFQVAWVVGVLVRMGRARGDESRRLRWFAAAVVLDGVALVVSILLLGSPVLGLLAAPVIPLAAGVAILRYRLYDIDPVINKALVVGVMAALVTAGYVAVVGGLVGIAPGASPVLPLVATALVAVAFDPVRRRVQRLADRLVYGPRSTPYEALSRLSAQLSRGDGDLLTGLASTVADGVGATDVTLWIGGTDLVPVASWPRPPADPTPRTLGSLAAGGRTHVRPVVHRGALRGAVTLTTAPGHTLTAAEARLLDDLVAQAGLVVDNVGLGAELQRRVQQVSAQAAELRAAARRIVSAQYEARRRLERDLHDGAQQQLVTLALDLRAVSERVDRARRRLGEALAELREMARGIHPAVLTEDGLEAALDALAERAPLPVQIDLRLDRRLAEDVEATAYFVVGEALTNAAKHSGASVVTVTGGWCDGTLQLEVTDDGRGGARAHHGGGLQGLADRVAAAGGRLAVHSPVAGGTRVCAEIPCA